MVAQEPALRQPDRLRTLTLGCTSSGGPGALPGRTRAIGGHDVRARPGEIAAPTLVIHGDEDRMLDVATTAANVADPAP